jgi:N,N'-diacetyllegionaminate synthase
MTLKKNKTLIIAEIGVNHNGNIKIAEKLIFAAKKAGADYAKFQMYIPEEIAAVNSVKAKYQDKHVGKKISQLEMLKKYSFNYSEFRYLYKYCKKIKIKFLASVFDCKSLKILSKFKIDFIKLPSSEIDNFFLLEDLSKNNSNIIFSTGMSHQKEINNAYKILSKNKKRIVTPMYCVSSYPTQLSEIDFYKLIQLKKKYKTFGFSDHTKTNETAIISTYLGATIIEKHLTLNKKMRGPDHTSSLDPKQFKNFVDTIKNVDLLKLKNKTELEMKNKKFVRKYLVAKTYIITGAKFSKDNITAKRCGGGLSSKYFKILKDKKSIRDYKKDENIIKQ